MLGMAAGCERLPGFIERDPSTNLPTTDTPVPVASPTPVRAQVAETGQRRAAADGFVVRRGNRQPVLRGEPPTVVDGNAITLNLQNAQLSDVVRIVLQEGLGASYVLDPAVSGEVTFFSNSPLRPDQLLSTLEEILRQNDAAIVQEDGVYRILPREQVGLSAPVFSAREIRSRGLVATVTPLRFVTANDIAEVLDGFSPVAGAIRYDRARNLVFVVGTTAEQRTIQSLLATLDVNFFAGRSFALHPLNEAQADDIAIELTELFATPSGGENPAIRFLPISRIDSVLIISEDSNLLTESLSLARGLDQNFSDAPRLTVFPVANRRAEDIAAVLGQIFNVSVASTGPAAAIAPGFTPEIGIVGGAAEGADGVSPPDDLATAAPARLAPAPVL
ncbi:MAG: secretin N-terminal domain-containing protein, partial [Pseudomonadota bacterium]